MGPWVVLMLAHGCYLAAGAGGRIGVQACWGMSTDLDGCLLLLCWLSEVYQLPFAAGFSAPAWVGLWGWTVFLAVLWLGFSAEAVWFLLCFVLGGAMDT